MREIVSHIVKGIALQGDKADFDGLPLPLQLEVRKALDGYKSSGGWLVISNNGMENYAAYAETFIKKVGYQFVADDP